MSAAERHGAASLGGARTSPTGRWPGVTPTPARCPECGPGPPSAGLSRPCPDWLLLLVFLKPEVLVLSGQLSHAHFLSGSSGGAGRGPLGGPGVSSGGPLAERGSPRSDKSVRRKAEEGERNASVRMFPVGRRSECRRASWAARLLTMAEPRAKASGRRGCPRGNRGREAWSLAQESQVHAVLTWEPKPSPPGSRWV